LSREALASLPLVANADNYHSLKQIHLIEKCTVFLLYSLSAAYVLCKVGKSLHCAAFTTISIFLIAEAANVGFYIMELYSNITDDNEKLYFQIPIQLSQLMLMGVLFYYTYEIKIVLIKV
jgi:hypothetical protein